MWVEKKGVVSLTGARQRRLGKQLLRIVDAHHSTPKFRESAPQTLRVPTVDGGGAQKWVSLSGDVVTGNKKRGIWLLMFILPERRDYFIKSIINTLGNYRPLKINTQPKNIKRHIDY